MFFFSFVFLQFLGNLTPKLGFCDLNLQLALSFEMARAGGITGAVNVGIAVQADWENREFISHISLNIRRLFEFLVQFGVPFLSLLVSVFRSSNNCYGWGLGG